MGSFCKLHNLNQSCFKDIKNLKQCPIYVPHKSKSLKILRTTFKVNLSRETYGY